MYTIETQGLSHQFTANDKVLNQIDLKVPEGSIFGFLGSNGAGKTTTLRLVLGLLQKQQGEIKIFGKPFDSNRVEILKEIGSLIESPSIYSHLTAKENLRIFQHIYQCPKSRIEEVLETVGLSQTGKKKAGKFSLGMKQRLSIAIAMMHNPKLLVLDEPTNGLDPNGIIEVRELLVKLNRERGVTIIISSHLLAEIEKMVTHIGIINKGSMLFQGTLADLHQKQHQTSSVLFEVSDTTRATSILSRHGFAATESSQGTLTMPVLDRETMAKLNRELVNDGIDVYQMSIVRNDLESIFMDLTKN